MSLGNGNAISARALSKRYRIGERRGTGSLYEAIGSRFRGQAPMKFHNYIWALHGVDLDVPHGHVLGVLGRNGSGKTTLMKIFARVTAPTQGYARVMGRVAPLLQVGAGFHPQLTGRDNIALSGAILGMRPADVRRLQPEIIEFADIGDFVDTPVKRYSSGMYMRLAFSVSAHLRAEVMLVDEVLSVGDAAFQRKCQERIRLLVHEGRTVLFVSHGLGMVRALCDSAIVLDKGELVYQGATDAAAEFYEREVLGS